MDNEIAITNILDSQQVLDQYSGILKIRINHSYAGFFAYVTFVINQLRYCEINNLLPVVYFGPRSGDGINGFYDERYGDNSWDYYFEPVESLNYAEVRSRIENNNDPLQLEHVIELDTQTLWDLHAAEPDSVYNYPYGYYRRTEIANLERWYEDQRDKAHQYISKYIKPKRHILEKLEKFWDTNLSDNNVLGIHMRGSDKGTADASPEFMRIIPPKEYYPHIDSYIEKNPDCKIFLATDQSQFVDEMIEKYGERIVNCDVIRTSEFGRGTNVFGQKQFDAYLKGEEVLIDCLLLSKCDFLIRCTSAVGEYAMYFNRKLKCIDLNLPKSDPSNISDEILLKEKSRTKIPSNNKEQCPETFNEQKIDHKSYFGPGNLFEGIILINLDDRPERLKRSTEELKRIGLDQITMRMSAFKHEYGMYGCSVSHVEAIRYSRWKGWKSVLIFEDDIRITDEFNNHVCPTLKDLSNTEWGIFQFGGVFLEPSHLEFVTINLFRYKHCAAAHAIAIHERTFDYIIDYYICEPDRGNWSRNKHTHFDEYVGNDVTYEYECYGSTKLLISQYPGKSDTWEKDVNYKLIIEEQYKSFNPDASLVNHTSLKSRGVEIEQQNFCMINFANTRIVIQWIDQEHFQLLRFMFGPCLQEETRAIYADLIIGRDLYDQPALWHGDTLLYSGHSQYTLCKRILDQIISRIPSRARRGLLIKAHAITYQSYCVIFPGLSNPSITELFITMICDQDWSYFTNKYVFFDETNETAHGLFNIYELNKDLIPKIKYEDNHLQLNNSDATRQIVNPKQLGRISLESNVTKILFAYPEINQDSENKTKKISSAESGLMLLGSMVNGHNLPNNGFNEVKRIAKQYTSFSVSEISLSNLIETLKSLCTTNFEN